MIHLNEVLKDGPLEARIGELTQPQIYFAPTIYNFYDARQEVQSTSFIRACLNGNFRVYRRAVINFQNILYRRIAEDAVKLEDISGELEVGILSPQVLNAVVQQQGISDGDRIQLASIVYEKANDRGYLFNINKSLNVGFPQLAPQPTHDLVPSF